mgnify:FL=1
MENTKVNNLIKSCIEILSPLNTKKYVVAFSGGIDSSVLLFILIEVKKILNIDIRTIHINHNLLENNKKISDHCIKVANAHEIHHSTFDIFIDDDSNIEEKCRLLRYDTLCKNCRPDEAILTAHHFDDQIETFMLRILRGSSLKGLSSMKKITTMNNRTLIRPFLDIPRDEIKNYQNKHKVTYIDDPSNTNNKYDRNFIRNTVLPSIKSRWSSLDKNIHNNLSIINIQHNVLHDYISSIIKNYFYNNRKDQISIDLLNKEGFDIKVLILHEWVYNFNKTNLNLRHIKELIKILNTNNDSNPLFTFDSIKITKDCNRLVITNT